MPPASLRVAIHLGGSFDLEERPVGFKNLGVEPGGGLSLKALPQLYGSGNSVTSGFVNAGIEYGSEGWRGRLGVMLATSLDGVGSTAGHAVLGPFVAVLPSFNGDIGLELGLRVGLPNTSDIADPHFGLYASWQQASLGSSNHLVLAGFFQRFHIF